MCFELCAAAAAAPPPQDILGFVCLLVVGVCVKNACHCRVNEVSVFIACVGVSGGAYTT